MDFILNEKSLHGQFLDEDDFLRTLATNMRCFTLVKKHGGQIHKITDFYKCMVTPKLALCELSKTRKKDELLRLRYILDGEIQKAPFWDLSPKHDYGQTYMLEGEDVSATAVAEAAVSGSGLLSFKSEKYADRILPVENGQQCFNVISSYTARYLTEHYRKEMKIEPGEYLKARYEGTRIDCSILEKEYDASNLMQDEFELLIGTLDKFASHPSWDTIGLDDGLEYKKYTPSPRHNWFAAEKYSNQTIMKFRFNDRMRCFGYRKGERFRLLRIERDHHVSDYG